MTGVGAHGPAPGLAPGPVLSPVRIDRVVVVIPVRNEAVLLPRCLTALHRAAAAVPQGTALGVLLVLDCCTDASAAVAAQWPRLNTLTVTAGSVGAARRAGVRHLLSGATTGDPAHPAAARTWIANTDADSAVPPNWLTAQLTFARNGAELVLGTVYPDDTLPAIGQERWAQGHLLRDGHRHVHGANLGVRADRYLEVGGFASVAAHEDALLVAALRARSVPEVCSAQIAVLTSGRVRGRAPEGFADYLRDLQAARA